MSSSTNDSLTSTGSVTLTKPQTDTVTFAVVSGTYTSVTFVLEASIDGTNFFAVQAIDESSGVVVSSTISPTNSTVYCYKIPSELFSRVRVRTTAVGSGQLDVLLTSSSFVGQSMVYNSTTSSQALSGLASFGAGVTFTGSTGANFEKFPDNLADALSLSEGSTAYLTFISTDASEAIQVKKTLRLDAINVSTDTSTGTKIGTAAGQKIGFYNATPVIQRSAYTQTYSTATRTHSNPTATTLTVTDGVGTNDGTIGAITNNATTITAVQELAAAINALIVDVANVKGVVNSVVDDSQALGFAT
jgi:hypothetical protein